MKISLRLLLGIVFLSALAVNGVVNSQKVNKLRAECESLDNSVVTIKKQNQFFEERKLVYERAFEGFQLRKEKLNKAPKFFEPVVRMHRKLEINNPEVIQIFSVQGVTHENFAHERIRLGIPESAQLELCLGYHLTESNYKPPLNLTDSANFSPKELFTIPLNPGESLVEFTMPYDNQSTSNLVELKIDGVVVHQATRPSAGAFWRVKRKTPQDWPKILSGYAGKDQVAATEPIRLVTVNAWPNPALTTKAARSESLSLVIRPIVEKQPIEEKR